MFGIESYKNKDELLEEQYKAKYLKYKQKYLKLSQTGGLGDDYSVGQYVFLTTEAKAQELIKLISGKLCGIPTTPELEDVFKGSLEIGSDNKKQELKTIMTTFYSECNIASIEAVNQLLHDNAYRIKLNSQEAILVKSDTTIDLLKKRLAKTKGTFSFNNTQKVDSKQNKNVYKGTDNLNIIKNAIDTANSGNRDQTKTLKMSHYIRVKFVEIGVTVFTKTYKFELEDLEPKPIPPAAPPAAPTSQ